MDVLTRWCELIPLRTKEAAEVAEAFFSDVICRHGVPAVVTADNGGEFEGVFDQLLRCYGVRQLVDVRGV